MEKLKLNNGLTIILEKKPTETVTIQATVKTGSNNENKQINGISHFIEHMLYKGTPARNAKKISEEIENNDVDSDSGYNIPAKQRIETCHRAQRLGFIRYHTFKSGT